ncbi:MAG: ABC transporter permease subunit [Holosporales bacterium]|jgi:putrescine transport system permease protein|nr:ABC transporter permease subunit [Holosporales bacterium]
MFKVKIPGILIFGYAFLYIPILFLIVFSFNDSLFPGVWAGFSLRWYEDLYSNTVLLQAVKTSLQVATLAATGAVVLGTMGALALNRFGKFKGRTLFSVLSAAPLVMPEIILGISLLLMFVIGESLFGIPSKRGVMTVTVAHITLAMSYVILIVQARLSDFDMSLEEAALDLGARPFRAVCSVTIPIIAPAILASWLLSFALSLDDVVIASFLTGAQATTLPILIFSSVKLGITPEINALATILVGTMSLVITAIGFILYRRSMQKHPFEKAK